MKMKSILSVAAASFAILIAGQVSAQQVPGLNSTSPNMPVTGNVPTLCAVGAVGGQGNFPLGVLIDTATGKMRAGLTAPDQTITGSW